MNPIGDDLDLVLPLHHFKFGCRLVSVDGEHRRSIFKLARLGPFKSDETVSQDGDPPFVALDDARGWGEGLWLDRGLHCESTFGNALLFVDFGK